jgi:1-deoxy-D-xylulose-5-phosphate reductoisomerase
MRLPILYALGFPERLPNDFPRLNFKKYPNLTFEDPDTENFRNLALAYEAIRMGGNIPCALNAANEIAVGAFLEGKIGFIALSGIIEEVLRKSEFVKNPSLDDLILTNDETRTKTELLIHSNHF